MFTSRPSHGWYAATRRRFVFLSLDLNRWEFVVQWDSSGLNFLPSSAFRPFCVYVMTPKNLFSHGSGEQPSASAHAGSQKDQLDGLEISRRSCCSRGERWLAVGLQWVRSPRCVSTTTPTEITGWVRHTHTLSLWEGWNSPLLHSAQPFTTFRGWTQVCVAMAGVNVNTLMSKVQCSVPI